jgi:hypothetical protein
MATKVQLDLFVEENEISILRKEMRDLVVQQEKMKRNLHTRHQDLSRLCLQLKEENEQLKHRLDRLESLINKQTNTSNDDLLEKLFQEAYLFSS